MGEKVTKSDFFLQVSMRLAPKVMLLAHVPGTFRCLAPTGMCQAL